MPLRRSTGLRTVIALCLTLLLPGLGGAWLRYAHDCPVQRAAVVQAGEMASAGEHAHHAPDSGSTHGEHQSCQCVGTCDAGAARALPAGQPITVAAVPAPAQQSAITPDAGLALPLSTPSDLLPLPNAPPIA